MSDMTKKRLKTMTTRKKAGQMTQLAPYFFEGGENQMVTGPLEELKLSPEFIRGAGSVLGNTGAAEAIRIQRENLKNGGIPLLFMADVVHGYRTIFPIPLGIAAGFSPETARKTARVSAIEAAAAGVHVTFSPMADLVQDPRWGRVMEAAGEDPYLNGVMARAFVEGYQDESDGKGHVAACVKHFAGYGASEAGRDYNLVDLSPRKLRSSWLEGYKEAVKAGAKLVMTAFNTIDLIPCTGNRELMREILRDELGFDGVVISDWGAVGELKQHGVARDGEDCARLALLAGCDIEMMTSHYAAHLEKLTSDNGYTELMDEAAERILQLKEDMGLFDDPYRYVSPKREEELFLCEEHRAAALEAAAECAVLLKNNGLLPLDLKENIEKLALIGPFAHSRDILGGWSCDGRPGEAKTLWEVLSDRLGEENIILAQGCRAGIEDVEIGGFEEALKAAEAADVIVLALGEDSILSAEGGSRAHIGLPGVQTELVRRLKSLKKPMAAVLFNGRPLEIRELSELVDAVLEAWYPGTEGAQALADIILGEREPGGRLPMSFPCCEGQIPVYYNHINTGRPKPSPDSRERYCTHYLDIPNEPLYPFGYGLSYTQFKISDPVSDRKVIRKGSGNAVKIKVTVTNTGIRAGKEVIQLYLRDETASLVRPVKELKRFEKVSLEPGESRTVQFTLTEEDLKFYTINGVWESEPGEFILYTGRNSEDLSPLPLTLLNTDGEENEHGGTAVEIRG